MNVGNRLEHVEASIESAQGLLDHAEKIVTGLDAANQWVERMAAVLRQAAVGLIIGAALLAAFAVRHRTR